MVKCSVKFCKQRITNSKNNIREGLSFFRFPADSLRCFEWLKSLGRPDLKGINSHKLHNSKFRICSEHFHRTNCFSSMLMNRLKKEAMPTIFPEAAGSGPYFDDDMMDVSLLFGNESLKSEGENMKENSSIDEDESTTENEELPLINSNEVEKSKTNNDETDSMIVDEINTNCDTNIDENVNKNLVNEDIENKDETENSNKEESLAEQNGSEKEKDLGANQNEDNDEEYDDFNPLLLCPDISLDVDESPVVTTSTMQDGDPSNDDDSNALFAPLFSTFVDEMTGAEISFNLTADEQSLREKLYGAHNPIEFSKIHCSACNVHLGSALAGQNNRFVHPLLKVLICKECYHFYTSGEFEKDEDGSELYCRWCGQGGQVLCCSKCEFVFCKKCIRINFGRRKLTEVRDSDEWNCFRCDMSQIKSLRAMCVEFFEYVRRETARATSVGDTNYMNRDLTICCQSIIKKRMGETEENDKEVKKAKKKRDETDNDPDYNPLLNAPVPGPSGTVTKNQPILPKPITINNQINFIGKSPTATLKIGNAVINVNNSVATVIPKNKINPIATSTPKLQHVLPKIPSNNTPVPRQPIINSGFKNKSNNSNCVSNNSFKHDWFEKTVRAAARVNSNLSYTLTQLNKAQANASSVEQLAVVHNKLQEILSSSINSLIQIRKSLRTEFIAGIKTIRFPPKPTIIDLNDDDVTIVSSSTPDSKAPVNQPKKFIIPKTIGSTRVVPATMPTPTLNTLPTPTISTPPLKGYIKVRSFSQLQTVSSECITIPDDDPPKKDVDEQVIIEPNATPLMDKDPLADDNPSNKISNETVLSTNKKEEENAVQMEVDNELVTNQVNGELIIKEESEQSEFYNVKENPSPKIRRMLSVKVNLKKTPAIENMVKKEPTENGDV